MTSVEFGQHFQQWGELLLLWVGFGTLVGLMAKAIMPGRDPGGSLATLLMGIGGAVIGCGVLTYCYEGVKVSPISPAGFCVATAGAFMILFFYRLLAGYWFIEGDEITRRSVRRRRGRRWYEAGE
ncbi:GlsB/YeaQ/YmgE family stress response membrane protein [Lignipirellula cremea]|uniref:Transglycosylase associated protein n=1 Tax=Lignipirellula cremea TaxID=2528010 RepID=A0A518E2V2_9BACT|nr:GlsB/YeaQ/YmgE family stress response membrane protein [Lignipirellula cremea]QDU98421.1 hypothetical protein Pla8534_62890 [Lignipirellula cremea]